MAMTHIRPHRPVIGVVPSRIDEMAAVKFEYLNALWQAGGVPVPLSYTTDREKLAEYARLFDGFLFSGGVDLEPARYGEETCPDCGVEVDLRRDAFEAGLFEAVRPTGKPILGICRGIQTINVWMGGTLRQHVDGHRQSLPDPERAHPVEILGNSLFYRICGRTEVMVNSFHHQVIKDLAPGLTVDAYSPEGYVEAAHCPDHPFLFAVQFHPESYCYREDDDHGAAIFDAFIEACAR